MKLRHTLSILTSIMESNSSTAFPSSIRWAFNFQAWNPTEKEWQLASRCVQVEEKDKIGKFVFKRDAKSSMAGKLLARKFAHLATGANYNDIKIDVDENGRPCVQEPKYPIDFNVSHQGSFTILAGEVNSDVIVGADIMHFERKTGHQLSEFFRVMRRTFSEHEWETILASNSEEKQIAMFYRHWCLKESYLKATGVGIRIDLRRISFKINNRTLCKDKVCSDTTVFVDGKMDEGWCFHEWLLDSEHCVSVALSSRTGACPKLDPAPFQILDWAELMREAKPLLAADNIYCSEFLSKHDHP